MFLHLFPSQIVSCPNLSEDCQQVILGAEFYTEYEETYTIFTFIW